MICTRTKTWISLEVSTEVESLRSDEKGCVASLWGEVGAPSIKVSLSISEISLALRRIAHSLHGGPGSC